MTVPVGGDIGDEVRSSFWLSSMSAASLGGD